MQIKQISGHVQKTASKRAGIVLIGIIVALYGFLSPQVTAFFTGGGCIASINPTTANLASSVNFVVTVTNAGSSAVQWVDVAVPANNYIYNGNSIASPWSTTDRSDGTTAVGGSIGTQQSNDFSMTVITGIQSSSPQDWVVKTSTSTSGASPVTCTGSLSTSVTGSLPQDGVNGVSSIDVSRISQHSATISWVSDFATSSLVYYGTSDSYNSSSDYDQTNVTEHAVTLSGLAAATTYHFQVAGTDGAGAYIYSLDNTFVTASTPVVPPPSSGTGSTGTTQTTTTVPRTSANQDTTPPQINIKTKIEGVYKNAPVVSGEATDNQAVATVEYSIDDGTNWLPSDTITGKGTSKALFSFKPDMHEDGDYIVLIRVVDKTGNSVTTARQTVVIDSLPPAIGGALTTLGTLIVKPDNNGVVHAPVGVDQKITVNAVGGPITVTIDATDIANAANRQSFSLTRSVDTGLWSGALNFHVAGAYQLVVRALDGAGNNTERTLSKLIVDKPATVTDSKTHQPIQANVTVYYRDPDTKTWVLWDGLAYGQSNPAVTSAAGTYNLYLPGGIYYMKFSAEGHSSRITKSFTVDDPTTVATDIDLSQQPGVRMGSLHIKLPWVSLSQTPVSVDNASKESTVASDNTVTSLPDFSLLQTDGTTLSQTKLFGKPTVISFVTTWSQPAQTQLAILSGLDRTVINVVAVDPGESQAKLIAYQKIAGSSLPIVVDSTNSLTANFGVTNLPTTFFVDRHGVIKKVKVGVLSKEEILGYVSNGL